MTLATLPGKGLIRVCGTGCTHVTWGRVTLDFRTELAFLKMARQVKSHTRGLAEVQLAYGHASLRFTADDFDELAGMVAAAAVQRQCADYPHALPYRVNSWTGALRFSLLKRIDLPSEPYAAASPCEVSGSGSRVGAVRKAAATSFPTTFHS